MSNDLDQAIHTVLSYIKWHNRPEPGYDIGRVNSSYLNWLNGYRDSIVAFTQNYNESFIRWGIGRVANLRPGCFGGMEKAIKVWWNNLSAQKRDQLLGQPIDIQLDEYISGELIRLGVSSALYRMPSVRWQLFGNNPFGTLWS